MPYEILKFGDRLRARFNGIVTEKTVFFEYIPLELVHSMLIKLTFC